MKESILETSKTIYSNRANWYVRGRPTYPAEVLEFLANAAGLSRAAIVADVGSGTGIFSALMLAHGCEVFAVEPNAAMRLEAERCFGNNDRFHSVNGSAEDTTLRDASVDIITVAQALHWFDQEQARLEFQRILRGSGSLVFIWNERRREGTPFLREFDSLLLELLPAYADSLQLGGEAVAIARNFLLNDEVVVCKVRHQQQLDEKGLLGRVFSSSYAPSVESSIFAEITVRLQELYRRYQANGVVQIEYETIIIVGCF